MIRHRQTRLGPVQGIDICNQVTTGAVRLDQLHHAGGLVHAGVWRVLAPAHRSVRHLHGLEDVIPELIVDEQAAHGTQEFAGFSTLNDAVIVGRGDGHQLAYTHFAEAILGCTGELGRVIHGAHADDGALALG